ncbi:DNA-binding HxlR family transcriptional regulator [Chitinophaga dinghuensis]|uniref:DNA-binding HxlR family transcriptional regulator n=1 Tax=Chitinophaga dinghuensis TaxID=1539050 RepID=A0A327VYD7_9BACT|nr:winged helix-turn-helix transcriptional regulator [Chitinophaga dinghuensis]RAJ80210.1 DNA-binding HxlR family transcriptional regulator [Chitinophaga dinghuensis]
MGRRKENSTNSLNEKNIMEACDSVYSICKIGGRWKMLILCELKDGKLRFGELRKNIPGITERMLTLQLRELEKDMLVSRIVYPEIPPRVEYELTPISRQLIPIWSVLGDWAKEHKQLVIQQLKEVAV